MDKDNFESYEYLPNPNASENEQFFVVQDNGTFMITRQPVQFTSEVQTNKETLETIQVYNMAPQQFLVDVNNSPELISVSDEFIIPNAENNLYANNYLLQPGCSASSEPMDQDTNQEITVDFKQSEPQINLDVTSETSKQVNSCTEITLTDEQYRMLEQKGWILLEISDKIYVLDTLGLHDITSNPKIIEKFKGDSDGVKYISDNQEIDTGNRKLDNVELPKEEQTQENICSQELPQFIIQNNIVGQETTTGALPFSEEDNNKKEIQIIDAVTLEGPSVTTAPEPTTDEKDSVQETDLNTRVLVIENEDICRVGNTLKVKTKLSLKDFPDKIILGKSVSGKNLIVKVIKPSNDCDIEMLKTEQDKPEEESQYLMDKLPTNNETSEFNYLVKHFFHNNITKCSAEDIVTADSVISQLLQIPTFKNSVMDSNLVITKFKVQNEESAKTVDKGSATLVTGKVSMILDQWRFVHLPHMLQKMVNDTREFLEKYKKGEPAKQIDHEVLHVQISETRETTKDVVKVSVTVNKRYIPIHLLLNKQKQPNPTYACCFCAQLFKTELQLKDHQATHTLLKEDTLTIDMEQSSMPSEYYVVTNGKTKSYACMQCDAKFTRLTSCKNHLKTHFGPANQDSKETSETENDSNTRSGVYKCNMCPSTYFHPSTLSKHIVARHIKINN